MDRRNFIKTTSVVAGVYAISDPSIYASMGSVPDESWFNRPIGLSLLHNLVFKF